MKKVALFLFVLFSFHENVEASCVWPNTHLTGDEIVENTKQEVVDDFNEYNFEELSFGIIKKSIIRGGHSVGSFPRKYFLVVDNGGSEIIMEVEARPICHIGYWINPKEGDTIVYVAKNRYQKKDMELSAEEKEYITSKPSDEGSLNTLEDVSNAMKNYRPRVTHHYDIFSDEIYYKSKFRGMTLPKSGKNNALYGFLLLGILFVYVGSRKFKNKWQK